MIRKIMTLVFLLLCICTTACDFGSPGEISAFDNCFNSNGWDNYRCGKYSDIYDRMFYSFSFKGIAAEDQHVETNFEERTITLEVPENTNLTYLVAVFTVYVSSTVTVGGIQQFSSSTSNDFTTSKTYKISAPWGANSEDALYWTVTVVKPNSKAITYFYLYNMSGGNGTGIINETSKTISVSLPKATDVTQLVASFDYIGKNVKVDNVIQVSSETVNDFTSPVVYTVTARNNTTVDYIVTVTLSSTVPVVVPSCVGEWLFNGNANDTSGNGNNGTVNGATLVSDRFGRSNNAYSFNGTSNYINCGSGSSLNLSSSVTLCAWIKTSTSTRGGIISKWGDNSEVSDGPQSYSLRIYSGKIEGSANATTGEDNTNSGINYVNNNSWHFIVMSADNTTKKMILYVDGVLDRELTISGTIFNQTSSTSVCIGVLDKIYNNGWYQGLIDDVRIYSRALSTSEVSTLYHEGGW